MEEINYDIMRYDLDSDGYILNVYFGCSSGTCTGYEGNIPEGYETLLEWTEKANIRAYKIVEGNLTYDGIRDKELQEQYKQEEKDNCCVTHKDLYGLQKEIEDIQDVNNSQYQKAKASGKVIKIGNVKKAYPKVKLTNINPYSFSKVDLITNGKNMLVNEAITQTINGVTFTQNEDRSITINGTATANIEYNIAGTSENTSAFLCIKKGLNYYLSSNSHQIKMYYYDGTDRSQIYSGTGGSVSFTDSDKLVTQIVLSISSGTSFNNVTIYPQLEYGTSASTYETYKSSKTTIDFEEYIEDGLFPREDLFPSDTLFPMGTTIEYILIENGKGFIKVNGSEEEFEVEQIHLFDGYNTIYTMQDTYIEIEYCINELAVDDLSFLQGKSTTTNKFKVLEDGSIEAHNGYFSGDVHADNVYLTNGGKVVGEKGLLNLITVQGNTKSYYFFGANTFSPLYFSGPINREDKDSIEFTFDIPSNFTIDKAYIKLEHMPLEHYGIIGGTETDAYLATGYCRNLRLYKGNLASTSKGSINWNTYYLNYADVPMSEVTNAFGSNGFTGSVDGYTYTTSRDLKADIEALAQAMAGSCILDIQTGDSLGTFDYEKYGSVKATLYIYGYTNYEGE